MSTCQSFENSREVTPATRQGFKKKNGKPPRFFIRDPRGSESKAPVLDPTPHLLDYGSGEIQERQAGVEPTCH